MSATNGTTPHRTYTPEELARLTAASATLGVEDLDYGDRLERCLGNPIRDEWLQDWALETFAHYRHDRVQWVRIRAGYDALRGNPRLLQEAVDAFRAQAMYAVFIPAATVAEEAIDWLWEPYIARKTVVMLDGDPGAGKTMFACQLAANVTRGYPMPDQLGQMTLSVGPPASVLMVAMEDHLGSVIRPRLVHCQADLDRLTFVNEIRDNEGNPRAFTLADLFLLEAYMAARRPALVYIDAIQAVLGGKVDINQANQVKALLLPLEQLAKDYNCAIVCSRHPNKPGANVTRLIHRGMASQSFIGSARSGLFVEEYPYDKSRSLLVHYKTNMGAIGRTFIFSKHEGRFTWQGPTRLTEDAIAGSCCGPQQRTLLVAMLWLEQRLHGGLAWPASDLETEAEAQDIAANTLQRAKKALGVVSAKGQEKDAGWTWRLPPLTRPTPSTTATTSQTSPTSPTSPDFNPFS